MPDRKTNPLLFLPRTLGRFIIVISMLGLTSWSQPAVAASGFQGRQEVDTEINRAHEKASLAQKKFQTAKKLSETGSASRKQVRVTELKRDLAVLELSSLIDPSRRSKNRTIAAKLVLKYRIEDLAIIRRLYERGSASKVTYRRAVVARDVARANAALLTSETETQRKLKTIEAAKLKHQLAKKEFAIAEALFESGSVAQADYERLASDLEVAAAEWESARKSLGATATVVE